MVQAYILIQTEVGRAAAVASDVAGIDGIAWAQDVTGAYDVIALGEAPDAGPLDEVVDAAKKVPGITRTVKCPAVAARAAT